MKNTYKNLVDVNDNLSIPLSWVASHKGNPYINLGDALSPVIVSLLSGLPVKWKSFNSNSRRLISVGSIGQNQKGGSLLFWGTGFSKDPYTIPPKTEIDVAALRGKYSAGILGVDSKIYGDPVILLPELFRECGIDLKVEKKYELGIITHISELKELTPYSETKYDRYLDLDSDVCIINTMCYPSWGSMIAKLKQILSCRRIASVSLHGLVLAELFNIPNSWLGFNFSNPKIFNVYEETEIQDFRMIDFYSGLDILDYLGYGAERHLKLNTENVIKCIDSMWKPKVLKTEPLREAFPFPQNPSKKYIQEIIF